jgi:AraC family transcriptional regulator
MSHTIFTHASWRTSCHDGFLHSCKNGCAEHRIVKGGMSAARLRRVTDYIENHLSEKLNITRLASVTNLSVHHFISVFTAKAGISPYRYLLERRVRRAMTLLLESDTSIAQIANDVGFSGQSHLTLHFRRQTGTTPQRFRLAG